MKRITALLGLTLVLALLGAFSAAPAMANGCTPGFWKNRAVKLGLYNTSLTVDDVFNNVPSAYANLTLGEGLALQGGNTLDEKKEILLRAAIAAWLNYTVQGPGVYWTQFSGAFGADGEQFTVGEFVGLVNTALASTNESDIVLLASHIDVKNNEHAAGGIC